MGEFNLAQVLEAGHVALRLVSARLVTLTTLAMTFVLFCWAMYLGTTTAVVSASLFGVLFLCVLYAGRRGNDHAGA